MAEDHAAGIPRIIEGWSDDVRDEAARCDVIVVSADDALKEAFTFGEGLAGVEIADRLMPKPPVPFKEIRIAMFIKGVTTYAQPCGAIFPPKEEIWRSDPTNLR